MSFELPDLPFAKDALEPHMSANTLDFHHGKHHNTYVVNLNNLVKDTPMADQSLEDIMKATAGDAAKAGVFNNAAQVYNHTFFWNCLTPNGGGNSAPRNFPDSRATRQYPSGLCAKKTLVNSSALACCR